MGCRRKFLPILGFLSPLLIRMAGELIEPPETTTASRARTIASVPSFTLTRAPMQRWRDAVGVKLARLERLGAGDVAEVAKSRRSTPVSMRNSLPAFAASASQETVPPCFSPYGQP